MSSVQAAFEADEAFESFESFEAFEASALFEAAKRRHTRATELYAAKMHCDSARQTARQAASS
jgi:hypothetical protein